MRLPIYQVDAFTSRVFGGNPAAICPLDAWLPDATLQSIAAENNLAETAFFVRDGDSYRLRWFTPTVEVDLCGHATLASGWLLLTRLQPAEQVTFHTRSGALTVTRDGDRFALDFPSRPADPSKPPAGLLQALGGDPADVLLSRQGGNFLLVYRSAADVLALKPNFAALGEIPGHGFIVTAPGTGAVDFVSRYFAPAFGIPEDPVTGAAHCTLIPYWSARLGKTDLVARQVSARGGELFVGNRGERVKIAGQCAFYMEGSIEI